MILAGGADGSLLMTDMEGAPGTLCDIMGGLPSIVTAGAEGNLWVGIVGGLKHENRLS